MFFFFIFSFLEFFWCFSWYFFLCVSVVYFRSSFFFRFHCSSLAKLDGKKRT